MKTMELNKVDRIMRETHKAKWGKDSDGRMTTYEEYLGMEGTLAFEVKRSKGQSAVEKASYISRSILVSEFDGQTYRPKYHEDLVHSRPMRPKSMQTEPLYGTLLNCPRKGRNHSLREC